MTKNKLSLSTRIPLNSGTTIPLFGFGAWNIGNDAEAKEVILTVLEAGYRHIDTAAAYLNEAGVGAGIRESGIPRSEIFLTTKLANIHQRDSLQKQGFERSLEKLKLDYVDLYLEHWPVPGRYKESWKVMEDYCRQGLTKAIGVSNFRVSHLKDLLTEATVVPAVDQIEFNPGMQDNETLDFCRQQGITVQAWSPFGHGKIVNDPAFTAIGAKYGKTGPQAVLRWLLQKGIIVFPKSARRERIIENADIFDFELSEEDCRSFDAMNTNTRTGTDPDNPSAYIYREIN